MYNFIPGSLVLFHRSTDLTVELMCLFYAWGFSPILCCLHMLLLKPFQVWPLVLFQDGSHEPLTHPHSFVFSTFPYFLMLLQDTLSLSCAFSTPSQELITSWIPSSLDWAMMF